MFKNKGKIRAIIALFISLIFLAGCSDTYVRVNEDSSVDMKINYYVDEETYTELNDAIDKLNSAPVDSDVIEGSEVQISSLPGLIKDAAQAFEDLGFQASEYEGEGKKGLTVTKHYISIDEFNKEMERLNAGRNEDGTENPDVASNVIPADVRISSENGVIEVVGDVKYFIDPAFAEIVEEYGKITPDKIYNFSDYTTTFSLKLPKSDENNSKSTKTIEGGISEEPTEYLFWEAEYADEKAVPIQAIGSGVSQSGNNTVLIATVGIGVLVLSYLAYNKYKERQNDEYYDDYDEYYDEYDDYYDDYEGEY